jgi:inorganic pyrophosphatase
MLPKIDVPIYELELISTGEKIKFRPFTVKEEKLFLMAAETDEVKTVLDVTKQIINNCVLNDIDVEELPTFDIENLFLNLRSKSIGEVIVLKYKCNNNILDEEKKEEKVCGNLVQINLDLNEIKPTHDEKHNKKIEIDETIGIVMKYPNMKTIEKFDISNEMESTIKTIISCIDYIYDKENIYYAKDTPKEELIEFIESLQTRDLQKIKNFFDTFPKLQKEILFKCNKCNYEEKLLVEGIESFFV